MKHINASATVPDYGRRNAYACVVLNFHEDASEEDILTAIDLAAARTKEKLALGPIRPDVPKGQLTIPFTEL